MNFHEVAFTYAQAFRTPARPSLSGFLTGAGAVFKFLVQVFSPRALSSAGAPPFPRILYICECGRICKVVPRNASMVLMIYRSCRASGEQRKAVHRSFDAHLSRWCRISPMHSWYLVARKKMKMFIPLNTLFHQGER